VSETILTLRWFLVDRIIEELKGSITTAPETDNTETMSLAMDYNKLINSFSKKLGRVMSRYS
jgi:DNA primase